MIDSPASPLANRLQEMGLIDDADWRRCSAVVAGMSRDLPRYDSVYVDALKQLKKLTPFQAQQLFENEEQSLRVRNWILLDQLEEQVGFNRYLVRQATTTHHPLAELWCYELPESTTANQTQILSRVQHIQQALKRLGEKAVQTRNSKTRDRQAELVFAEEVFLEQNCLVLVQPVSSGWSLRDLLIRRGRLPIDLTASLLNQGLGTLQQLREAKLIHGDIRPETLRMTDEGEFQFCSAGLRPILIPKPALYDLSDRTVSRYWQADLIQPAGQWTSACDLYSFGLTLWELAAGRPAYLHADPFEHLAARQRDAVPAISDHAPNLDPRVAEVIDQLCACTRPMSHSQSTQFLEQLQPVPSGPVKVQSYINVLPMPHRERVKKVWSFTPVVMACLLLIAVTLPIVATSILNPENQTQVAAAPEKEVERKLRSDVLAAVTQAPAELMQWLDQAKELPEADLQGSVTLESGVCYQASQLNSAGMLKIAASGTTPAFLVIDEQWEVQSVVLSLENLVLIDRRAMQAEETLFSAAVSLSCRELECSHVTDLLLVPAGKSVEENATSLLEWTADETFSLSSRRIRFQDCLLTSHGGLMCVDQPGKIELDNVLTSASVPLIQYLTPPEAGQESVIALQNVCSRGRGPLFESITTSVLTDRGWRPWLGSVRIEATDSLFAPSASEEPTAMLSLIGDSAEKQLIVSPGALSLVGRNVLLSPAAAFLNIEAGGTLQTPPSDQLGIEGVVKSAFEFAGPATLEAESSALVEIQGPRFASQLPGIEPNRLTFGDSSVTVRSSSR